jgi:catechol 2,3-dioxygenase-like lactoylglutathione lyase family enzyme
MSANPFSHIDLRVRELEPASAFYRRLLPELGFTELYFEGKPCVGAATPEPWPRKAFFELNVAPDHQANQNRIAFAADSPEKVDAVGRLLRGIGAKNIEGPELVGEYSAGYYAVFFEDPSGNLLEVVFRPEVSG